MIFRVGHSVTNHCITNQTSYLNYVEHGFTFQNVQIQNKTGVDPDPVCNDFRIIKKQVMNFL